jgi:hypothetical protein
LQNGLPSIEEDDEEELEEENLQAIARNRGKNEISTKTMDVLFTALHSTTFDAVPIRVYGSLKVGGVLVKEGLTFATTGNFALPLLIVKQQSYFCLISNHCGCCIDVGEAAGTNIWGGTWFGVVHKILSYQDPDGVLWLIEKDSDKKSYPKVFGTLKAVSYGGNKKNRQFGIENVHDKIGGLDTWAEHFGVEESQLVVSKKVRLNELTLLVLHQ